MSGLKCCPGKSDHRSTTGKKDSVTKMPIPTRYGPQYTRKDPIPTKRAMRSMCFCISVPVDFRGAVN